MRNAARFAAILIVAATSLHALPPNPGPPPPPGCPRDLKKAQDDLTKSQSDLAQCQANAAKSSAQSPATSPDDALAKAEAKLNDWPQLKRYAADNAALPAPDPAQPRVVFYGDSITDSWGRRARHRRLLPRQALHQPRHQRPDHPANPRPLPAGRRPSPPRRRPHPRRNQRHRRQHRPLHPADDGRTTTSPWPTSPAPAESKLSSPP